MTKIRNAKTGRLDGGLARLFDTPEIGALLSECHATCISAGLELESLITDNAVLLDVVGVNQLFEKKLLDGIYLIPKKVLRKSVSPHIGMSVEPDFVIVRTDKTLCYVVELKDGDCFDTKKASAEVSNLKKYCAALDIKLPYPWNASYRVCMFNQEDKGLIVTGFKKSISESEAMTGREFCSLLGISHEKIMDLRMRDREDNTKYFIQKLLSIPDILKQIRVEISD